MSTAYDEILAALHAQADAERAPQQRAYLKSERDFLGVTLPVLRREVTAVLGSRAIVEHDATIALAIELWDGPYFECRLAAVMVLVAGRATLVPADLDLLESLIRGAETWALVDELAATVTGTIVEAYPEECAAVLDRWSIDPDSFWIRRSSLLALLIPLRRGAGDWERFCRYADSMLDEREFFIRKAIGWVLRDTSKRRPEMVRDYVTPRMDRLSGVTRREAVKYL